MNTIVFPSRRLLEEHRALRLRFSAQGPALFSFIECEVESGAYGVQILVPPRRIQDIAGHLRPLRLVLSAELAGESAERLLADGAEAALALGHGVELGRATGWIRANSGVIVPVDQVILPGPGLLKVDLRQLENGDREGADGIFPRVEGALSPGAFRSLRRIKVAFIGVGRLNTCLATVLARDGVRNFALIDPDFYELHNGGGGFAGSPNDVGLSKTRVLATALRGIDPSIEVEEVPHSVTHLAALQTLIRSDVLVSAADHDAARLAAGVVACLHNKVLLEVGTGISNESGRRRMGADIRLIWPGRCLGCVGGVRAPDEALRVLTSAEAERLARESPVDWRQQRAGSLASLNAVAAGVAARVLEDFVGGRVTENGVWVRIEFDERAGLRVEHPQARAVTGRCFCRWAGSGHEGLRPLLNSLTQAP